MLIHHACILCEFGRGGSLSRGINVELCSASNIIYNCTQNSEGSLRISHKFEKTVLAVGHCILVDRLLIAGYGGLV